MRIVNTLHERKAVMAELSDAFVALPGGLGTLEELAEVVSWAQLGLHAKPIGLLGVRGYWDDLLRWLDGAVAAGFVPPANRGLILEASDLEELLARFGPADPSPTHDVRGRCRSVILAALQQAAASVNQARSRPE